MDTELTAVPGSACTPQTLTAVRGVELTVCAHGGHVLGWTPAGGRPRLWLSPLAQCGPGLAIRGGVPVIFPQFSDRGPLPKHGLARDRGWQVSTLGTVSSIRAPGPAARGTDRPPAVARWQAVLTDDDETRRIWPHGFELTLAAGAAFSTLEITLTVRNTGDTGWAFAAALHSYLALGDPAATIHGLGGRTAQDNAADGHEFVLGAPGEALAATEPRDVAVRGADEPLLLDDPVLGPLLITSAGFPDRVVWNPGPGHHLGDVPAGAEANFVCLEPAALTPIQLAPGETWSAGLILRDGPTAGA